MGSRTFLRRTCSKWSSVCSSHMKLHMKHRTKTWMQYQYTKSCSLLLHWNHSSHGYSTSSLYVSNYDSTQSCHVDVDLDLPSLYGDAEALKNNLRRRNIDIDAEKLTNLYSEYASLLARRNDIEQQRSEVTEVMKLINKDKSPEAVEEKKHVAQRGRKLREELKSLLKDFSRVEEDLITTSLKLPVYIDSNTPDEDTTYKSIGKLNEFDFTPKSHTEIATSMGLLKRCAASPGAFYLLGNLVLLERNLIKKAESILTTQNLIKVTGPDIYKTIIEEATGKDFADASQVLKLESKEEVSTHDTTYFLSGVGTEVFTGCLTRMSLLTSLLPLKLFSTGTAYHPGKMVQENHDLCNTSQSNVISIFGACSDYESSQQLYEQYTDMMETLYKWSGVPARLQRVCSSRLERHETGRVDVQVWMPSYTQYVTCGSLSLNGDYFSRRLMMKHAASKSQLSYADNFIHTVSGTMVDCGVMLAAVVENNQHRVTART